jgi:hypothetical protein
MKKLSLLILLSAIVALSACKKDNKTEDNKDKIDSKQIVSIVFQQALFYDSGKKSSLGGTEPFSYDIDYSYTNPDGGTVKLNGLYSGNVIISELNQTPLSMTTDLNFTETFTDWAFKYDYADYTMTTSPGLTISGHSEYNFSNNIFSNYYQNIKGTIIVKGANNYSQTNVFDLKISLTSQGNGGTVTGTVDGVAVSYSVP